MRRDNGIGDNYWHNTEEKRRRSHPRARWMDGMKEMTQRETALDKTKGKGMGRSVTMATV